MNLPPQMERGGLIAGDKETPGSDLTVMAGGTVFGDDGMFLVLS